MSTSESVDVPTQPQGSGLRQAFGFLTVLGRSGPPTHTSLPWFGPVGALVGAATGATAWACGNVTSPLVAAAMAVAVNLAITGLLHFDGLIDSADALLPPVDRQRRLDIFKDPHTGAFGTVVAVLVLVTQVSALASIPNGLRLVLSLAGVGILSRSLMALTTLRLPYARASSGGGLASAFTAGGEDTGILVSVLGGIIVSLALCVAGQGAVGALAFAAGLSAFTAVVFLALRRIGGFTGDVLGAAGTVAETVAFVALTLRWPV